MKDRIKNEVTAFLKSFPFGKVPDANQLAEHFYNLALEDVKKEVEKNLLELNDRYNVLNRGEIELYQKKVLRFIENQEV